MAESGDQTSGETGAESEAPSWGDLHVGLKEQTETPERALLFRIAEARGRRVPISELVHALGLPPAPCLDQDLPGLKSLAQARGMPMPVVAEGTDENGWYWMSPRDSGYFAEALRNFNLRIEEELPDQANPSGASRQAE